VVVAPHRGDGGRLGVEGEENPGSGARQLGKKYWIFGQNGYQAEQSLHSKFAGDQPKRGRLNQKGNKGEKKGGERRSPAQKKQALF